MLAESFAEYGAYRAILDEKHFDNGIYWLFRYELHVSSDYNYTDGDTDVVVALKRPGDKDKSDVTFLPILSVPRDFCPPWEDGVYRLRASTWQ